MGRESHLKEKNECMPLKIRCPIKETVNKITERTEKLSQWN